MQQLDFTLSQRIGVSDSGVKHPGIHAQGQQFQPLWGHVGMCQTAQIGRTSRYDIRPAQRRPHQPAIDPTELPTVSDLWHADQLTPKQRNRAWRTQEAASKYGQETGLIGPQTVQHIERPAAMLAHHARQSSRHQGQTIQARRSGATKSMHRHPVHLIGAAAMRVAQGEDVYLVLTRQLAHQIQQNRYTPITLIRAETGGDQSNSH
ncbi:MAG: hypothetical protein PVG32_14100 [Anaerolineales bacterium]